MSTYYYFRCLKCDEIGSGTFTRQAWGWGNFDIIECFKFLAWHTDNCGEEHLRVVSEHDDITDDAQKSHVFNKGLRNAFLENARGVLPNSDDWVIMNLAMQRGTTRDETDREWTDKELER